MSKIKSGLEKVGEFILDTARYGLEKEHYENEQDAKELKESHRKGALIECMEMLLSYVREEEIIDMFSKHFKKYNLIQLEEMIRIAKIRAKEDKFNA